jgi:hypothetical protein
MSKISQSLECLGACRERSLDGPKIQSETTSSNAVENAKQDQRNIDEHDHCTLMPYLSACGTKDLCPRRARTPQKLGTHDVENLVLGLIESLGFCLEVLVN